MAVKQIVKERVIYSTTKIASLKPPKIKPVSNSNTGLHPKAYTGQTTCNAFAESRKIRKNYDSDSIDSNNDFLEDLKNPKENETTSPVKETFFKSQTSDLLNVKDHFRISFRRQKWNNFTLQPGMYYGCINGSYFALKPIDAKLEFKDNVYLLKFIPAFVQNKNGGWDKTILYPYVRSVDKNNKNLSANDLNLLKRQALIVSRLYQDYISRKLNGTLPEWNRSVQNEVISFQSRRPIY